MKGSAWVALSLAIALGSLVFFVSSSYSQEVEAWTSLGLYGGQIYDIEVDRTNPDKMFAGGYLGDGLFVTTNGGADWQVVEGSNDPPEEGTFRNHAVWAVKIAASDPAIVWATHNYWAEKSTDGGETWSHIWNGTMQSPSGDTCPNCPQWDQFRWCRSLAIDPSDSQTVYVGTGGRYTNWKPHGAIYVTEDGGTTWKKLSGPVFDEPGQWTDPEDPGNFDYDVVALALDANNPDIHVIWAVTNNSGVFVEQAMPGEGISDGTLYRGEIDKQTGEETWTEVFSMDGGKFYDVEVEPGDSNQIFTANDWGMFRHYFKGGEWKYQWILNFGGQEPSEGEIFARQVRSLSFDPKNTDILYASWSNSISKWANIDTRPRVARGTPPYEDENWEIYNADHLFLDLAVHPEMGEVVFGGENNQGVFESQDHGQSWTPINEGISAIVVYDVDVDPYDPSHLLAGTISGVYEKRGAGDWTNIPGPPDARSVAFDHTDPGGTTYYAGTKGYLAKTTGSDTGWFYSDHFSNDFVSDIAVGPSGNAVFITTRRAGVAGGTRGVYRSEDGLATPALIQVLSSDTFSFNVVAIDPNDPSRIFAGGGDFYGERILGNLYQSTSGGDPGTWQMTGLRDVVVNALLIDPRDSNIVYAGCGSGGGTPVPVYKSTDGGAAWTQSYDGIPELQLALRAIWGASPTDVFVVGSLNFVSTVAPIFYYDGSAWSEMDSGATEDLYGVWGSSLDDVFAVGDSGTIIHYDGSSWMPMSTETEENFRGVWGNSSTEFFAVGNNGTILYYNGTSWSSMNAGTTEDLRAVWGASTTEVFAVGASGTILHYDGTAWAPMSTDNTERLSGVWGSSGNDVFAVGDNGTILHYDGSAWSSINSGTTEILQGIWGASATEVFAVGEGRTVLYYNGTRWAPMSSVPMEDPDTGYEDFVGVWGSSAEDIFVLNWFGAVLHYDSSDWTFIRPSGRLYQAVTDMEFHPQNKDFVYASTMKVGVYVSPNGAERWLNLGRPKHNVGAISTSSLYAATEGGMLQCTGTGVVAGSITDRMTGDPIDHATILSDLGVRCTSVNGKYMMINPAGIGKLAAIADGYANETVRDVAVYGGDVAWVDISMVTGVPEPGLPPGHHDLTTDDGGGYCFIATAAYGSPMAKQVQVLREFRDTYLLSWGAGRRMVDLYYTIGKVPAAKIEAHQWAKPFVRVLLYPAIGVAWLSLSTGAVEEAVAGLVLAAFFLAAGRRFGNGRLVRSGLGPRGLFLLLVAALAVWGLTSSDPVHASTIFKQVGIASSPNPVGSGARAMGMAGAFIAIADDATAASWNPGGLVQVEKPEISVVGAYFNRSEELTSGVLPGLKSDTTVDGANLNYLSVTYPFHLWTNWVVSLNYQRLYDFKRELDYAQDFRDVGLDLSQDKQYFQDGYLSALGIAGAVEILPRFSFGATFNLWTDQLFWRNGWEETFVERAVGTVADEGVTIDTHIQDKYEEFRGINFNVGLLWNPFNFLTIGAVVKTPFTASLRHEFRFRQVQTFDDPTKEPIETEQSITENVDLKMPISYGIGIAGRISDALSLDLDVYRTHWSDYMLEDSQGNKFSPIDGRPEDESDVKDTTMVRLGAEYLVIMEQKGLVVPVRGRFFYDPEPAHGSVKDFFGIALGSGVAYKWVAFDLAYQLRWGTNVDTGNLIATTEGDILQHNFLFSLILHL